MKKLKGKMTGQLMGIRDFVNFKSDLPLFSNDSHNLFVEIDCSLLEFHALFAIPCTIGLQAGHYFHCDYLSLVCNDCCVESII